MFLFTYCSILGGILIVVFLDFKTNLFYKLCDIFGCDFVVVIYLFLMFLFIAIGLEITLQLKHHLFTLPSKRALSEFYEKFQQKKTNQEVRELYNYGFTNKVGRYKHESLPRNFESPLRER